MRSYAPDSWVFMEGTNFMREGTWDPLSLLFLRCDRVDVACAVRILGL